MSVSGPTPMPGTEAPYAQRLLSKITLSMWLHAGLFLLLLRYGAALMPEIRSSALERSAREYTLQSERAWSQQRIDDLEEVKRQLDAMAETQQDPEAESLPAGDSPDDSPPASMEEMYEQAQELLADIEAQEKSLLDDRPPENTSDTQFQLKAGPQPSASDPTTGSAARTQGEPGSGALSETEMAEGIGKMQGRAREALARVEQARSATGGKEGSGNSDGTGTNYATRDIDPGNHLATESHFNQQSRGVVNDISEQMRRLYQAQEQGSRVSLSPDTVQAIPPPRPQDGEVSYGRRIEAGGRPVKWLVLDSWYFIGPFPNRGRVNLETQFPPEHHLNLDAIYLGNDQRILRWQHVGYHQLPLLPPDFSEYAVYYAYTELYSDQARNVWLAIGSDDQSKLWVNGLLVWRSVDYEKPWEPAEGYRKIRLMRGTNRILFRLENGIHRAAMSVMLRAADTP
jgi:hypothetical protein